LVDAEKNAYEQKAKIHFKDNKGNLLYVDSSGRDTTKAEFEGFEYSAGDDNNGRLYSEKEIKDKLKALPGHRYGQYGDNIHVNNGWVELSEYFKTNYAKKKQKVKNAAKLQDGVYTFTQRERFKSSSADVLTQLKAKASEISSQISKLANSLDDSPWAPKEYQESHLAGLKGNLQELEKLQHALQGVISGYDKLLTTSDPEKLTDPKA
jgi:hypothetical protein